MIGQNKLFLLACYCCYCVASHAHILCDALCYFSDPQIAVVAKGWTHHLYFVLLILTQHEEFRGEGGLQPKMEISQEQW